MEKIQDSRSVSEEAPNDLEKKKWSRLKLFDPKAKPGNTY
jgi:hypothetical protein